MVPVDECKLSILKKEHRIFCTFCASNSSYKMEGRQGGDTDGLDTTSNIR